MGYFYSTFAVASEDDVTENSKNGLLDLNRLEFKGDNLLPAQGLLGWKFLDLKLQDELPYFPFLVTEDPYGFPLVHSQFGSSDFTSSPAQLLTPLLSNLRKSNVCNFCIGIPTHFTYHQRKDLLAATSMARLLPCRLLHETTAAALAYRFSETNLPQTGELFNMAFVYVGNTSMQVSLVELRKDQLRVLSHAHDESIGRRAFIQVLLDLISDKCKIDSNQMSYGSLVKHEMLGDENSFFVRIKSVENLGDELSTKTRAEFTYGTEKVVLRRAEFEEKSSKLLRKVREVLQKALNETRIDVVDVHSVLVMGDGSKMPAIVNIINNVFQKQPNETLRKHEPIATGCFIECAKLCLAPEFLRFQIIDFLPYSIGLSLRSENESTLKQLVVFSRGSPFPDTQVVRLNQAGLFYVDIISINTDKSQRSSKISTYKIEASEDNSSVDVKVKVQLDIHGIAYIESAEVNEEVVSVLEYPYDEHKIILQDKVRKAEKELADVSMHLENTLGEETKKRAEVEKRLEELHDSKVTLEHQFEELKKLLETTRNQKEQLQIQRDNAVKDNELSQMKVGNFTEFTRAELEEVTNNFDNSCKIGEGGFASVYKAFLRYTNVAIKMLKSESSQGDIEFDQEMEILTKVRHPNLVSLIGANAESRALIFEFVPNGSLDAFLTKGENLRGKLSWQERIRIASELCSALIFLHSVPPHGIAHGDLKPQNILLDSNLVSKLADFGISRKLYKTNDTFTPLHETLIPKYTPAYCAPEFFSTNELTPRCDIYSFGIILLQLVTGRDARMINHFVEEALKMGNFNNIVDDSAGNWPIQEAEKLASLGLWCSHLSARERPDLEKDVWPSIDSMKHVAGLH